MGDLEALDPSLAAFDWRKGRAEGKDCQKKYDNKNGFWAFIKRPPY